jgi:hypothetical protein
MKLVPIVNVEVKMPKSMLNALTLYEAFCIGSKIDFVTESDVVAFLSNRFGSDLASTFKPNYLFSSQEI